MVTQTSVRVATDTTWDMRLEAQGIQLDGRARANLAASNASLEDAVERTLHDLAAESTHQAPR